jgi:hypothetical protein
MTVEKILIAEIGGEGGSVRIYARQRKDVLVFWHEGCSWDVDEDVWFGYHSEPVPDLEDALPVWWMNAHPVEIHPLFVPWFREHYHASRRHNQDMGEGACCFGQNHWLEILESKNRKDSGFFSKK